VKKKKSHSNVEKYDFLNLSNKVIKKENSNKLIRVLITAVDNQS